MLGTDPDDYSASPPRSIEEKIHRELQRINQRLGCVAGMLALFWVLVALAVLFGVKR